MAIKLVAIDMDGTLLNPQHEITAGVKSAIDRAHKKGVAVVLATGRPYVGIQRYLMKLGMVDDGQYCISYNGAHVGLVTVSPDLPPRYLCIHGPEHPDEINRAYEEGWIGTRDYQKPDGSWQRWAIAFIGDTLSATGEKQLEVFIVDLPDALEDYARPGNAPLEGTESRLPAPPACVQQRRLTFTRGLAQQPRHWLRSAPDGSAQRRRAATSDAAGALRAVGV